MPTYKRKRRFVGSDRFGGGYTAHSAMPPTRRSLPSRTGSQQPSAVKKWVATVNNPTEEALEIVKKAAAGEEPYKSWVLLRVKCLQGQLEVGESGTLHLQLSLWFQDRKRLNGAREIMDHLKMSGAHLEEMRGTWLQSTTYCSKEDGRVQGPWQVGEPPTVGKAALMARLVTAVAEQQDPWELMLDMPALAAHSKAWKFAQAARMRHMASAAGFRRMTVEVFVGDPGTGKTRAAVEEAGGYENVFILGKSNRSGVLWWDGYEGQGTVIIDDFGPGWGIPYLRLLRILDGHPVQMQVKGDFVWALYTRVVITTNVPRRMWYSEVTDQSALDRRITKTTHFMAPLVATNTCENGSTSTRTGGGNTVLPSVAPTSHAECPGHTTPFIPVGRRLNRADGFVHRSSEDAEVLDILQSSGPPSGVSLERPCAPGP